MNTVKSLRTFQRTFEQAFRLHHVPIRLPSQPKIRAFRVPAERIQSTQRRYQSTEAESRPAQPLTDRTETSQSDADAIAIRKALSPAYQLYFTCKKCLERSAHTISKQAYHFGTTVINCPKCGVQHLISDHLRIFNDKSKTLEEIAKEHGQLLRKGRLGVNGDVEFYDDAATGIVERDAQKLRDEIEEMKTRIEAEKNGNQPSRPESEGRSQRDNWRIANKGDGRDVIENENATAPDRFAAATNQTQSEEDKAMDERIRDALRETSRRQDG